MVVAWVFAKNVYLLIKPNTELRGILTFLGGLVRPGG